MYTVKTQQRDQVSNKVECEDRHPTLPSDLHKRTMPHTNECALTQKSTKFNSFLGRSGVSLLVCFSGILFLVLWWPYITFQIKNIVCYNTGKPWKYTERSQTQKGHIIQDSAYIKCPEHRKSQKPCRCGREGKGVGANGTGGSELPVWLRFLSEVMDMFLDRR